MSSWSSVMMTTMFGDVGVLPEVVPASTTEVKAPEIPNRTNRIVRNITDCLASGQMVQK
jgi:hypothetical protein